MRYLIFKDMDIPSPRDEMDCLTLMDFRHRRYQLGDGVKLEDYPKKDVALVLPVYMYDHSGQTISLTPFSCPWDSGQLGVCFVLKETLRNNGVRRGYIPTARQWIEGEVRLYDHYIQGNVYGYQIEDADGKYLDGCGGFYGDRDEVVKDMLEHAGSEHEAGLRQAFETPDEWVDMEASAA